MNDVKKIRMFEDTRQAMKQTIKNQFYIMWHLNSHL